MLSLGLHLMKKSIICFTTLLLAAVLSLFSIHSAAQKLIPLPNFKPSWVQEFKPFRIAGNLYYVGSYELCSYLITTPQGHILINTGLPGSDTMIRRHVEELGFKISDVRILLTNQVHFDHVGGFAAIKKMTGAQVMIEEMDAPVLADGGNSDFLMGGHGPIFQAVKADRLLHDRDTVRLGDMQIVVLHHPGHTKGACSYLFDVKDEARTYRILIANIPTLLDDTKFPGMPTYTHVEKDYAYTLEAMKNLQFDLWFAAHAGQFDLDKKHKPDDGYHPEAFADRAGYDKAIGECYQDYLKRLNRKVGNP
jgi:metallo-beta-lactamase class B